MTIESYTAVALPFIVHHPVIDIFCQKFCMRQIGKFIWSQFICHLAQTVQLIVLENFLLVVYECNQLVLFFFQSAVLFVVCFLRKRKKLSTLTETGFSFYELNTNKPSPWILAIFACNCWNQQMYSKWRKNARWKVHVVTAFLCFVCSVEWFRLVGSNKFSLTVNFDVRNTTDRHIDIIIVVLVNMNCNGCIHIQWTVELCNVNYNRK